MAAAAPVAALALDVERLSLEELREHAAIKDGGPMTAASIRQLLKFPYAPNPELGQPVRLVPSYDGDDWYGAREGDPGVVLEPQDWQRLGMLTDMLGDTGEQSAEELVVSVPQSSQRALELFKLYLEEHRDDVAYTEEWYQDMKGKPLQATDTEWLKKHITTGEQADWERLLRALGSATQFLQHVRLDEAVGRRMAQLVRGCAGVDEATERFRVPEYVLDVLWPEERKVKERRAAVAAGATAAAAATMDDTPE